MRRVVTLNRRVRATTAIAAANLPQLLAWRWCADVGNATDVVSALLAVVRQQQTPQQPALLRELPSRLDDGVLDALADAGGLRAFVEARPDLFSVQRRPDGLWTVRALQEAAGLAADELALVVPSDDYIPVRDVYAALSDAARVQVRDEHQTLPRLLENDPRFRTALHGTYVVQRATDGSFATFREPEPDPEPEPEPQAAPTSKRGWSAPDQVQEPPRDDPPGTDQPWGQGKSKAARRKRNTREQPVRDPEAPMRPPDVPASVVAEGVAVKPGRYPELKGVFALPPPPAPPSAPLSNAQRSPTQAPSPPREPEPQRAPIPAESDEHLLSSEGLCDFIPTFFTPLDAVLDGMPGYTFEHMRMIVDTTRTVQIVTLEGQHYVRLFGRYGNFSMDACGATNERFRVFEVQPRVVAPFARYLRGAGSWMRLKDLLERATPDEVAALPYTGPTALLCFSQAQHMFAFTPDSGGLVSLRRKAAHLENDTTPCPVAFNEAMRLLLQNPTDQSLFLDLLTPEARRQLQQCFPGVGDFVEAHGSCLRLVGTVLWRARDHDREMLRGRPLEEQLAVAMQERDIRRIRTLKRRIATQSNPDNPLLDPDRLAQAILEFVPPDRFILLRTLMRSLPHELLSCLPNKSIKFFNNRPEFQLFEYRFASNHAVCRCGTPLPPGALREDYDEADVLRIVEQRVMRRGGTTTVESILIGMPLAMRTAVRRNHGSLVNLLLRNPELFTMVNPSSGKGGNYVVTMARSTVDMSDDGPVGEDAGDDDDAAEALSPEERAELDGPAA